MNILDRNEEKIPFITFNGDGKELDSIEDKDKKKSLEDENGEMLNSDSKKLLEVKKKLLEDRNGKMGKHLTGDGKKLLKREEETPLTVTVKNYLKE